MCLFSPFGPSSKRGHPALSTAKLFSFPPFHISGRVLFIPPLLPQNHPSLFSGETSLLHYFPPPSFPLYSTLGSLAIVNFPLGRSPLHFDGWIPGRNVNNLSAGLFALEILFFLPQISFSLLDPKHRLSADATWSFLFLRSPEFTALDSNTSFLDLSYSFGGNRHCLKYPCFFSTCCTSRASGAFFCFPFLPV